MKSYTWNASETGRRWRKFEVIGTEGGTERVILIVFWPFSVYLTTYVRRHRIRVYGGSLYGCFVRVKHFRSSAA